MTEAELIKAQGELVSAQQNLISALLLSDKNVQKKPGTADGTDPEKPEKGTTLSEYAQIFLTSKGSVTKKSTYHSYAWMLDRHILPMLGGTALSDINNSCLQAFADEKLKSLSKKTVRDLVGLVKNILNDAAINEIVEPRKFMIKYPKSEKSDYRTLSEEEFRRLEEFLLQQESPHAVGELIMLETGMRIGEMCGLRWEDINLDNMSVKIRRTVQRIYKSEDSSTEMDIGNPKTTTGKREIPISGHICRHLKKCRRVNGIYVASGKEMPTEPRTHRQYHKRLMKKLGIEYMPPHGLRHTFATRAIQSGVDPKTVSAFLGHSNSDITLNIYTSVTEDMLRQGIDKMMGG